MWRQIVTGIIRHVLTVLGGALVTRGFYDADQLATVVGAVVTIIGVTWSAANKWRAKQRALEAVARRGCKE